MAMVLLSRPVACAWYVCATYAFCLFVLCVRNPNIHHSTGGSRRFFCVFLRCATSFKKRAAADIHSMVLWTMVPLALVAALLSLRKCELVPLFDNTHWCIPTGATLAAG